MSTKYRTELPCGTVITRTSKAGRVYSHILIAKDEGEHTWGELGYCGRYDLALKAQQQWRDYPGDTMIVEATRIQ